jgi:hypothetical protein
MTPMLAVAASLLGLSACERRITDSNIAVVNREFERSEQGSGGVTPKEVESVLGPPKSVTVKSLSLETQKKEVEIVRYYYEQNGQLIELHFLDNKLISRIPSLNPQPSAAGTKSPSQTP